MHFTPFFVSSFHVMATFVQTVGLALIAVIDQAPGSQICEDRYCYLLQVELCGYRCLLRVVLWSAAS